MNKYIFMPVFIWAFSYAAWAEEGLSNDQICKVMAKQRGKALRCYENGLTKNPSLAGRVSLDLYIETDGTVKASKVLKTTLHDDAVEGCLVDLSKTWVFPKPVGTTPVRVKYPFEFKKVKPTSKT